MRRGWLAAIVALVASLAFTASASAAGQLIVGPASVGLADSRFFGVVAQPDGKLIAAGETSLSGGSVKLLLARFNADGSLDGGFGQGGVSTGDVGTLGRSVAVGPNGQIFVAGQMTNGTGTAKSGMLLERFDQRGRLLGQRTVLPAGGQAFAIAIRGDQVVLAGSATGPRGQDVSALARFRADGSPDPSFGASGTVVQDLGDYSVAYGVAIQGDGKIVIGGSQRAGLQIVNALAARFDANGALDGSFDGGALLQYPQPGANSGSVEFRAVAMQGQNVVLVGDTPTGDGADALVVRLLPNGKRDPSFDPASTNPDGSAGTPGVLYLHATAADGAAQSPYPGGYGVVLSGADIIVAGHFQSQGLQQLALWAVGLNGRLDPGFGQQGRTVSVIAGDAGSFTSRENNSIALAPDGSLLSAGDSTQGVSSPTGSVARYSGYPLVPPPPPPLPPVPPPPPGPPGPHPPPGGKHPGIERLDLIIRRGLPLRVNCAVSCRVHAELRITAQSARHLGLLARHAHHGASIVIASASTSRAGGTAILTLHLTPPARRALRHERRLPADLVTYVRQSGRAIHSSLRHLLLVQGASQRR